MYITASPPERDLEEHGMGNGGYSPSGHLGMGNATREVWLNSLPIASLQRTRPTPDREGDRESTSGRG